MSRGIPKPKTKEPLRKTTRLVYTKSKPGFSESSPVLLGSEICVVQIDKTNKVYRILSKNEPTLCFALGNGKDVPECKRNARKKLMESGACMFDEIRARK